MELSPEKIRAKLNAYQCQERGDHMANPDLLPHPPYRPASVLIPLLRRNVGTTVLLTQRTDHLNVHPGQISFPGGGADVDDRDAVATALREAEEEIGLSPESVQVLGMLDNYITRTGFLVTPVVALVDPPLKWQPDTYEVADIFEVPLAHVLQPGALALQSKIFNGKERHFYAMTWQKFYIWGATAGMLKNFVDVVQEGGQGAVER